MNGEEVTDDAEGGALDLFEAISRRQAVSTFHLLLKLFDPA
jgi:hypothetical protein